MRAKQLKKIKVRLEEMQAEILGESEETVHAMQEESTLYPDPNDRASLETEHINNLRIRDRERKLLTKVEEALERVENKTFGNRFQLIVTLSIFVNFRGGFGGG